MPSALNLTGRPFSGLLLGGGCDTPASATPVGPLGGLTDLLWSQAEDEEGEEGQEEQEQGGGYGPHASAPIARVRPRLFELRGTPAAGGGSSHDMPTHGTMPAAPLQAWAGPRLSHGDMQHGEIGVGRSWGLGACSSPASTMASASNPWGTPTTPQSPAGGPVGPSLVFGSPGSVWSMHHAPMMHAHGRLGLARASLTSPLGRGSVAAPPLALQEASESAYMSAVGLGEGPWTDGDLVSPIPCVTDRDAPAAFVPTASGSRPASGLSSPRRHAASTLAAGTSAAANSEGGAGGLPIPWEDPAVAAAAAAAAVSPPQPPPTPPHASFQQQQQQQQADTAGSAALLGWPLGPATPSSGQACADRGAEMAALQENAPGLGLGGFEDLNRMQSDDASAMSGEMLYVNDSVIASKVDGILQCLCWLPLHATATW